MGVLTRLFRRRRLERELDEELRFHVESATRDIMAAGTPAAEARRRARASFGGLEPIKEAARDARGTRWIEDLAADLRHALRALRRQPGFALVAIATLALGIGVNTAMFSIVNGLLLRPLPVRAPEELVLFSDDTSQGTIRSTPFPSGVWTLFSTDAFDVLKSAALPLAGIAAYQSGDFVTTARLAGDPAPAAPRIQAKFVSGNFFDVLGVTMSMGRPLSGSDDRSDAPPVAVMSDAFWRTGLGGDPHAVGRTIVMDNGGRDLLLTVVGVAPASFFGVRVQPSPDLWVPLSARPVGVRARTDLYDLSLIGRLDGRHSMAAAQAVVTSALHAYLAGLATTPVSQELQQRIAGVRVEMASGARGISLVRERNGRLVMLLLAAVGVILLIACTNVGTLLLARAAAREREIAVRLALGAGRGRLVRQWLTESALLGGIGAVCGVGAAALLSPALLAEFVSRNVPVSASIDPPVLAFTASIAIVACLLFGLTPALRAGRVDPAGTLRVTGRGRRRGRMFGVAEPFIVVQVALSLVLVTGAALLVRTLIELERAPFGFAPDHVLLATINPRPGGYGVAQVGDLYRRISERIGAVPDVERVTFARFGPFEGHNSSYGATIEGHEPPPAGFERLQTVQVGPEYPQTLGMPLVAGRAIDDNDRLGSPPVGLVNEAFVTRYFPSSTPVGRHFSLNDRPYEIVGVVKDAQYHSAHEPIPPMAFIPMLQETSGMALDCEFEVRMGGNAALAAPLIRQAIAEVDARVGVTRVHTLREQIASTFAAERIAAGFIAAFAGVALLVAAIGLYGTVAHSVAGRRNEIGVRIALGAGTWDVIWFTARETVYRLGAGLVLGFALTAAASSALASLLFGVTPRDPISVASAAFVLTAITALAMTRPIRRALRTDPVSALRAE
jgi:predicted permease